MNKNTSKEVFRYGFVSLRMEVSPAEQVVSFGLFLDSQDDMFLQLHMRPDLTRESTFDLKLGDVCGNKDLVHSAKATYVNGFSQSAECRVVVVPNPSVNGVHPDAIDRRWSRARYDFQFESYRVHPGIGTSGIFSRDSKPAWFVPNCSFQGPLVHCVSKAIEYLSSDKALLFIKIITRHLECRDKLAKTIQAELDHIEGQRLNAVNEFADLDRLVNAVAGVALLDKDKADLFNATPVECPPTKGKVGLSNDQSAYVDDMFMFLSGMSVSDLNAAIDDVHGEGSDNRMVHCFMSEAARYFAQFTYAPEDGEEFGAGFDFIAEDWGRETVALAIADRDNMPQPGSNGWSGSAVRKYVYQAGLVLMDKSQSLEQDLIRTITARMRG